LVIAGCTDSFIYAWNAETGLPMWKFETEGEVHAAANVWTDPASKQERLFIGSYDYKLYCLNPKDGSKIWDAETGYYINGGSAVSTDGKIVFGGCDAVLHVHDAATGKEIKQIEVGAYIGNNVAIDGGVAYVSHYGNRVGAYSLKDGTKVWEYGERDFEYYAAPAVLEKIVVVGGRDKRLHGIDRATGKGLWEYKCRDRIDSSAVLCGGKHAVFGSDDGRVYVIDIATGKETWSYEIGAPVKTSPAAAGDWIIFGADDGVIYAFKNGSAK
jgi:outer membrane protein assembly factor BamB